MEDRTLKEGLCLVAGSALVGFYVDGAETGTFAGMVALVCVGRGSRWLQLQAEELAARRASDAREERL